MDDPDSAAVSPLSTPPTARAATTASTSRPRRSREREIGASISQNPSAAEASTGPKSRDSPSARANSAVATDQGSSVRAVRQVAVAQLDAFVCILSTRFTTIAPIIRTLKMVT